MFSGIRNYLSSWREVSVCAEHRSAVFDLMYKNSVRFWRERSTGGEIRFRVRERYIRGLASAFEEHSIEYKLSDVHGLAALIRFLAFRPAIVFGAVIFFAWMLYSSRIIWDVRVYGNTKTPTEEIVALLDELGCGIGDYYPAIDFADVHAKYAAAQHDIAWLSVYMNGTVAEVQVRELYADTRPKHDSGVYANIVAQCDGIVESVNVFEGQAAVKAGDMVKAGQVLISGVVENKDGSVRYEYAAGEVYCTVARSVKAEIVTEIEEKVYTGRSFSKKSVKIFKNSINLFRKCGIEEGTYDKIDIIEQLCPFGLCTVPIWINKTVYLEYEMAKITLSPEEATERAMASLNAEIRAATYDAELLSRTVDIRTENGVATAYCLLYLRQDVAKTVEFTLDLSGEQ